MKQSSPTLKKLSMELGGDAFYTNDLNSVHRVAEKLPFGMVAVDTGVIAQANVPFGGVKQSGFGREGRFGGLDGYMVVKVRSCLHILR